MTVKMTAKPVPSSSIPTIGGLDPVAREEQAHDIPWQRTRRIH